jgi:deazaflavin-dependent oxidoreductase (nitroreductase family)
MSINTSTPETLPTGPAAMERRARMMRRVNKVMRLVLGLPFPTPLSGRLMLLTHTGRRTGRRYRQPVSYVRDGDVLLTPGGGRWTRNLRDDEPVTVRLRGRDVTARPELIRDPDEVDRLLRLMRDCNPRLVSFVPFLERDAPIDRTKLETALGYGFCIVRWHLELERLS